MKTNLIMKHAQRGAEMVEYALVVSLIALALVVALKEVTVEIDLTYDAVGKALVDARPDPAPVLP